MPTTSNTYNFQSIEVELIIREAFENIGILGEFVEYQKLQSATRSLNLLLLEWMTKSINLWTLERDYLAINQGQAEYTLSNTVSNIIQANVRTSTRQLNGTPAASSGVAQNAFDGNPATFCDAGNNGNISYDYGINVTQQINFVGITSQITTSYSLNVETSQNNIDWTIIYSIPPQSFAGGVNKWFDIPVPINARTYRIIETNGANLNLQELYFNNNIFDVVMSNISRDDYYSLPNKMLQGRPNIFYYNRHLSPVLSIWPVPSNLYNCIQYTYKKMIQDVGALTNSIYVPSRFYPCLIWGLSWRLALKYNPQVMEILKAEYEKSFQIVTTEDSENTPINIIGDYSANGYYL